LIETKRLASLISFENEEFIFQAVHHSFRFCLLSMASIEQRDAHFAFHLRHPSALAEPERNFTLSSEQIDRINPNTRTAPVFRSRADAELTAKIYAHTPVLLDEGKGSAGSLWGVSFARLFDMSNDSGLFRTAAQLAEAGFLRDTSDWIAESGVDTTNGASATKLGIPGASPQEASRYVPLYEAKMIHQFDHRWATYANEENEAYDTPLEKKQNPDFEISPRYWVPETDVKSRVSLKNWKNRWLMGWRDICRSHDQRTVIFSIIPWSGVGHTCPTIFLSEEPRLWLGFLSNVNSLAHDYVARQSIGGIHLTYGYLKQFPVLPPEFYTEPRLAFIFPRVLELTYTSRALTPFARDLGFDGSPFAWDDDRRVYLRADLDAFYARAYGLTRDELRYILDPADVKGADYPSETFRVLKEKEIRQFGEYRTRRLVLAAWDRMETGCEFKSMGM